MHTAQIICYLFRKTTMYIMNTHPERQIMIKELEHGVFTMAK